MSRNVGTIDRVLRISLGLLLIALAYVGAVGPWGYIGLVPLLTGLAGRCPAYSLFGIRTCGAGEAPNLTGKP